MSKAARIRELLQETDLSNQEIAAEVGCLDAYVRVVQQRLMGVSHDRNWRANNLDRYQRSQREYNKNRYRDDPEYRERKYDATRRWVEKNKDHYLAYHREYNQRRKEKASAA